MDEKLNALFNPKSIAVIGASPDPSKLSNAIFKRLIDNARKGLLKASVYPVNPKYERIEGRKVYPSVLDIEGEVDLVIVTVPAEIVPEVLEEAGEKGVKAAIVISGGFAEAGRKDLEDRISEVVRKYELRVLGPNTVGLVDTYSGVDTLFTPRIKRTERGEELVNVLELKRGNVAIIAQSGALGVSIADCLTEENVGIRAFVSVGNQLDISVEELLEYFSEDDRTRVVMLYLEGVRDGRSFVEKARLASSRKPVIVLKAGKTDVGVKSALSHTASIAGDIEVYKGVFKQAGLIEAEDLEEFMDFGKVYSMQRPSRGGRLFILSNSGGMIVIASDAASLYGLQMPPLSEERLSELEELKRKGIIPKFVSLSNPLDLTASVSTEGFIRTFEVISQDPNYDMFLIIPVHSTPTLNERAIREIAKIAKEREKAVAICEVGGSPWSKLFRRISNECGIPSYPTPERAIRALHALTLYSGAKEDRAALKELI